MCPTWPVFPPCRAVTLADPLSQCRPVPERDPRAGVDEVRRRLLEHAAAQLNRPKSVPLAVPPAG